MGLLDRDYMRDTPRTHVGETQRPDLTWVQGSPRRTGLHPLTAALLALLVIGALVTLGLVLSGVVAFSVAH